MVKEKSTALAITSIHDSQESLISNWGGLSKVFLDFYSHLYMNAPDTQEREETMTEFLEQLSNNMGPKAKLALSSIITEQELHDAAYAISPNKCPGPNGFIVEFYKKIWYLVGANFIFMM